MQWPRHIGREREGQEDNDDVGYGAAHGPGYSGDRVPGDIAHTSRGYANPTQSRGDGDYEEGVGAEGSDTQQPHIVPPPRQAKAKGTRSPRTRRTFIPKTAPSRGRKGTSAGAGNGGIPNSWHRVYIGRQESIHPMAISVKGIPGSRVPSYGWMIGTMALMPMADIRRALEYMMANGLLETVGPTHDLSRIDELDATDGGMDIIMNEVRKLPPEALAILYDVSGRTRVAPSPSAAAAAGGYAYEPKSRDLSLNKALGGHDLRVPLTVDKDKAMLANLGPPESRSPYVKQVSRRVGGGLQEYDDPTVYMNHPARKIGGKLDHPVGVPVDLCGPDINRWTARTAHEVQRTPELDAYMAQREDVSTRKRYVCGNDPHLTEGIMRMVERGDDPRAYPELDTLSRKELKSMGFSDDDLARMYAPGPAPSRPSGENPAFASRGRSPTQSLSGRRGPASA